MLSRRNFLAGAAVGGAATVMPRAFAAQRRPTVNVKTLGASGTGAVSDIEYIRTALESAARFHKNGATIYFPPGEYYLGTGSDSLLVTLSQMQDITLIGERATISCRSLKGSSSMFFVAGCRNVAFEGLSFRDYGLNRNINWLGAAAIRLANEGKTPCENVEIRNCRFESVAGALVCRSWDGAAACRGITLTDLAVSQSYYGFNFQDAGDDVVGRRLLCEDVKRSYFPYGVSNHDIELETNGNTTGFTDVLIKCYHKDTSSLKVRFRCRGKRSGDAIVALDHQHESGRGTMRKIDIDMDIDDADCRLDTVLLIRSFDPSARVERETTNRWDDIRVDGDVRICDKTRLVEIASLARTPGQLAIGPRLARNPRLPKSFPGFILTSGK